MSVSPENSRVVFTHLMTATLGFGAAYLAFAFSADPPISGGDPTGNVQVLENPEHPTADIQRFVSNKDDSIPENETIDEDILAIGQPENELKVDEPKSVSISEYGLETSTLSFLQDANIDMLSTDEIEPIIDEFGEWVLNTERPAKEIYDLFEISDDDSVKHVLEWLIASQAHEGLANSLVNEISVATESEYPVWVEILSLARIDTYDARTHLLNTLGSIENEQLVATALRAVEPMVVNPTERAEYLSSVSLYADSPSEEIKLAAIDSLSYWSAHDYDYVITNELSNGNSKSQKRTLLSISNGNIRSTEIKQAVFLIMDDETQSMDVRIDAFNALSGYSFDEPEYNRYYMFYQQNIQPLEVALNRG